MALLDSHTNELRAALIKVIRWPYRRERDLILYEALKYIAKELGIEVEERK